MLISDISLWGVAAIVVLSMMVVALFSVIDRRLLTRVLRVLTYFIMSLAFVAVLMWGILKLNLWWVDVIWGGALVLTVSYLTVCKARLSMRPFFLPLTLSLMLGMGLGFGAISLLVQTPRNILILTVLSFLSAQVVSSLPVALKTYVSSLRHTQEHCQYLLANGATHIEAVLPSVRRSLRASVMASLRSMTGPLVLAPPLFFCGLLMGGFSPLAAAIVVLALTLMGMWVSVLATLLTIALVDRFLFDASGRFLY